MSFKRRLLGDVAWYQVLGSVLASVTAAWAVGRLGVAGTLIGAAVVSLIATLGTNLYQNTLQHGRTLIMQTDSGVTIRRHVEEGQISEAFNEVVHENGSITRAEFAEPRQDDGRGLRWKPILATSLVVLLLSLGAITAYELVTDRTWGGNQQGTTIGQTFGGDSSPKKKKPDPAPSQESPTAPITPHEPSSTPMPSPSATPSEPTAPEPSPPAETPEPAPTEPVPSNDVPPAE